MGFNYGGQSCKGSVRNKSSALQRRAVVRDYLADGRAQGRILGPFPIGSLPGLQVSRFGVIPKGRSGKWRLIVDLSSPEGKSVNDGIEPELCSMTYVSVDGAVELIRLAGRQAGGILG